MTLIIIPLIASIFISRYIYKIVKTAPIKYTDEKRFTEAIRYEERFSGALENDLEKLSKQSNSKFL